MEERPGVTVVIHAKRSSRRPWVHVDIRGLHARRPNMTRNYSRSRHKSRQSGGIGDMGPCNDTLIPDQSIQKYKLLTPILPHRPSESCQHMGSRWLPAASRTLSQNGYGGFCSDLHANEAHFLLLEDRVEQTSSVQQGLGGYLFDAELQGGSSWPIFDFLHGEYPVWLVWL